MMVYYIVSGLFLIFFWCPCMAINVDVSILSPWPAPAGVGRDPPVGV